jgi:hypothetical protein
MKRSKTIAVAGAVSLLLQTTLTFANTLDGLDVLWAQSIGPALMPGSSGYSVIWHDTLTAPASIRIGAFNATGAFDNADCPGTLGLPAVGEPILSVSLSALGSVAVDPRTAIALITIETSDGAGGRRRRLFWKEHNWTVSSTCTGWEAPWQEMSGPIGSAPAAIDTSDSRIMIAVAGLGYTLRYRYYNSYAASTPGTGTWSDWNSSQIRPCCRGRNPNHPGKPTLVRSGTTVLALGSQGSGVHTAIGIHRIDTSVPDSLSKMAFVNFTPQLSSGNNVVQSSCGAAIRASSIWISCLDAQANVRVREVPFSGFATENPDPEISICPASEAQESVSTWTSLGVQWSPGWPVSMTAYPLLAPAAQQSLRLLTLDIVPIGGWASWPWNETSFTSPGGSVWSAVQ